MVPECQRADPIVEEVALVIESAQCPLIRLQERDQMVNVNVEIGKCRDSEKHSKEQIMTCREQNLAC